MWPDALDWIIRVGLRRSNPRRPDWIIWGNVARSPVLDHLRLHKKERPPPQDWSHPGKCGLTPRSRSSGVEQEGAARIPVTGTTGEMWPDAGP